MPSDLIDEGMALALEILEEEGLTVPVTLHQATGEKNLAGKEVYSSQVLNVVMAGSVGQTSSYDVSEYASRIQLTVFNPEISITENDYFTWDEPEPRNHGVTRVTGHVRDHNSGRYGTRVICD